jgi:hypothetical protein
MYKKEIGIAVEQSELGNWRSLIGNQTCCKLNGLNDFTEIDSLSHPDMTRLT